jgi:hypothetical protein
LNEFDLKRIFLSGINLEKNYRLFIKTLNKFCELQI